VSGEDRKIREVPYIDTIRGDFENLFDSFYREFHDMINYWWPLSLRNRPTDTRPALRADYPLSDIEDKGTHYEIKVDLPGIDKENVDIKVTENRIEISGKQEDTREETSSNYILRERRCGFFTRSFSFPEKVVPDKAEAEMKNGILTITVPKKEPKKEEVHRIKIK